jgi:hypothetical protein
MTKSFLSYELVCLSYDQAGRVIKYLLVLREKDAILLLSMSTMPMQSCVNNSLHPHAQTDPTYVAQLTSQLASLLVDYPSANLSDSLVVCTITRGNQCPGQVLYAPTHGVPAEVGVLQVGGAVEGASKCLTWVHRTAGRFMRVQIKP